MSCNRQCFGPDGLEAVDVDCSECDGRDCGPVNALINYRKYSTAYRRTGMNKKRGDKLMKQYDECRANLEWLVYWCLRSNDPPISIGRGKELLGFTDMVQMRAWLADYSYRDNWGGNERDV